MQRAIASIRAAYHDFRSEYLEDVAEIKTELLTLRLGLQGHALDEMTVGESSNNNNNNTKTTKLTREQQADIIY